MDAFTGVLGFLAAFFGAILSFASVAHGGIDHMDVHYAIAAALAFGFAMCMIALSMIFTFGDALNKLAGKLSAVAYLYDIKVRLGEIQKTIDDASNPVRGRD